MTNHTNEDRAYMSAAVEAGCWVDREGDKYDAQRLESRGIRWWAQANTPFSALAAAGRAMGLHAEAKAILEEMAAPADDQWDFVAPPTESHRVTMKVTHIESQIPVMDECGRILATEGYVLVPRDVAENALPLIRMRIDWYNDAERCQGDDFSEVHRQRRDHLAALANALKKEE